MDSGLGGLSVVRALHGMRADLSLFYVADTGGFPYGRRSADDITARAKQMVRFLQETHGVRHIVLACNTLSTLCLSELRREFPALVFIGTVPAIKVAANASRSRRFTLLATPNTAHSDYSKTLIAQFAADCTVDCYGAPNLARLCEEYLLGQPVDDAAWREEIAPCFHNDAHGKTDHIIMGCTHYPLAIDQLRAQAPWPVEWIDSSAAIARQALAQCASPTTGAASTAYVTGADDVAAYQPLFSREGFATTRTLPIDAAITPHAQHA